ncbi:MAG: nitrilase-related carbon-nitrogen hydrolase [Bacteroidales bacterium]|nr:nitrilase-related carbon-nitrogen hydrolase [Bacteroidales bacterium]
MFAINEHIFMKVYICQCNLRWCDREGNRAHIEELLSQAGESGRAQGTAEGRMSSGIEASDAECTEVGQESAGIEAGDAEGTEVGQESSGIEAGDAECTEVGQESAGIEAGGLIVLPEMFSTGFITMPAGEAESDGASLGWMKAIAKKYGCAVAGSVATEDGGLFYNRFYFVKPDGTFVKYDKRHLFSFAGEDRRFTAGSEKVITEYNGVRFFLQICYDLRFPCFSRNILPNPYDAVIYVASWPSPRIGAWDTLLKARAIENQCYAIGVNRIGKDPSCQYNGHSSIVDPYGNASASCAEGVEEIVSADLDLDSLQAFRDKFPVLEDADR